MIESQEITIRMVRSDLNNIPGAELPDGFTFRFYQPGDRQVWIDTWTRADSVLKVDCKMFEETFYQDYENLPRRQVFICDPDNRPVATASAWYGEKIDVIPEVGKVHWVAVVKEMQGRGLARPLLTKVLDRLRELGHQSAFLYTQNIRIPAISLYLSYGFRPDIQKDIQLEAWRTVRDHLRPELADIVNESIA